MTNENQRTENLIAVKSPSRLDQHALATKFRLFAEDGTPIDIASFEARLQALEGSPVEVEAEEQPENLEGQSESPEEG